MDTFAARYSARHGLSTEKYEPTVFLRSLYPHARLLHPLISFIVPNFFEADHHLVDTMGRTTRLREFGSACMVYRHHLAHASAARRFLRLRVSVRRLYHTTAETFDYVPRDTANPGLLTPLSTPRKIP
jgi:hypothetical protein